MSLIDYYHFEDEFIDGPLTGAMDDQIIEFLSDKLTKICAEALRNGDKLALSSVANSRDDLGLFVDNMTAHEYCDAMGPNVAFQVMEQLSFNFTKRQPCHDVDYQMTNDDIAFVKSLFNTLNSAPYLVKAFSIDSIRFSKYVHDTAFSANSHPYLISPSLWDEKDIAKLYLCGGLLDEHQESVMHYENLPYSVISSPILNGLNKKNTKLPDKKACSTILPDAFIDEIYRDKPMLFVVQYLVGERIHLDVHAEDVESTRDYSNDFDASFIDAVSSIAATALILSHSDIIDGKYISDKKESVHLACQSAKDIDDVAEIIEGICFDYERSNYTFAEDKNTSKDIDDFLSDCLFEAYVYHLCAQRLEELAGEISNIDEANYFLRVFSNLMLENTYADGECLDSDSYDHNKKPCFSQAFIGYEFNNIKSLFRLSLSKGDAINPCTAYFVNHAPVTLVKSCILEITDKESLLLHSGEFHERCVQNKRYLCDQFKNRFADAIAEVYAHAELMNPGFGKAHSIEDAAKRFPIPKDAVIAKYLSIVNGDKAIPHINLDPRDACDMGFLINKPL